MRLKVADLQPGTNYAVQVRAVREGLSSEWSERFLFTSDNLALLPKAPSTVTWVVSGDAFVSTWTPVTQDSANNPAIINSYELEFTSGGTSKIISVAPQTDSSLSHTLTFAENVGLFGTPKPNIDFRVRAVNNKGIKGLWSGSINAVNAAPAAPSDFTAEALVNSVELSWTGVSDTDLQGYHVYVGATSEFSPSTSNLIYSGLGTRFVFKSTTYSTQYFKLRAVDKFNQPSTPDQVDSATPESPFGGGDSTPPDEPTSFDVTITTDPQGILLTQTASGTWSWVTDTSRAGFIIRYKIQGTTAWTYVDIPEAEPQQPFVISRTLPPGEDWDFEIRAYDRAGLKSDWVPLAENAVTPNVVPELTNALVIASGGYIESDTYTVGGNLGWRIDDDGLIINTGIISADTLQGGQIVSTGLRKRWDADAGVYVTDGTLPAWVIDLEGDADFNNVLVRGSVVVGEAAETPGTEPSGVLSTVASGNYIPGSTGWYMGSDGYVEFQNVVAETFDGNAIKADTVSLNTLRSGDDLTQVINVKGSLVVTNETAGSPGEGSTITLNQDGFFVRGATSLGNPDYITFPTTGAPNIISGSLQASTLAVNGYINPDTGERNGATFRGVSHIELESSFVLDNTIAQPLGSPSFSEFVPFGNYYHGAPQELLEIHDGYLWRIENRGADNYLHKFNINQTWISETLLQNPFTGGGYNPSIDRIIGFTRVGSYWYFLFQGAVANQITLMRYNDDGTKTAVFNNLGTITNEKFALGSDGTNVLLARWVVGTGTANAPKIVHYDAATLATTGTDVTYAASAWPSSLDTEDFMFGVTAGEFDYGAGNKTYIIGFAQDVNGLIINQVRAVNASGVRIVEREWPMSSTITFSSGLAVNRSNNRFYESSGSSVYEYSGTMWQSQSPRWAAAYSWYNAAGRTGVTINGTAGSADVTAAVGTFKTTDVGADFSQTAGPGTIPAGTKIVSVGANGDTATLSANVPTTGTYTITIAYETSVSNLAYLSVKKRRWIKVTGAAGPPGTVVKIYVGRNAVNFVDPVVSDLHHQTTLGGGFLTYSDDSVDFTTSGPKVPGTFATGTPGKLYAHQSDDVTISGVTVASGQDTLTLGAGVNKFYKNYVGATVTGTYIPAGTKIKAYVSPTQMTMTNNATNSSGSVTITITRPLVEIRGDGYVRISELFGQKTILTSTQDASPNAGNEPALRVGDINGSHLRIDGDEIIAMTADATQRTDGVKINRINIGTAYNGVFFDGINHDFPNVPTVSGGTANVNFNTGTFNRLRQITSLSEYKVEQEPISLEVARGLLEITPKTFYDRTEYEENGNSGDGLLRWPGVIAEEVEEYAPLFATYKDSAPHADRVLNGVAYDRLTAGLLVLVKDQQRRIEALESAQA